MARSRISLGDKGLPDGHGKYSGFGDNLRIGGSTKLHPLYVTTVLGVKTVTPFTRVIFEIMVDENLPRSTN